MTEVVIEGRCTCGTIRYRVKRTPLIVHCCHCRWCQRESGAAFALNAMLEAECVECVAGAPVTMRIPSNSGKGQALTRCPSCLVVLWSNYAGSGEAVRFVRVGTLDQPDRLPPDVHIFTGSKQPWLILPPDTPAFVEYYHRDAVWPDASLERFRLVKAKLQRPSA